MTISQTIKFPIWNKDTRWDTKMLLCWCNTLHGSMFVLLPFWNKEGDKNGIAFLWMVGLSIVVII
jgi:hypothetical protein